MSFAWQNLGTHATHWHFKSKAFLPLIGGPIGTDAVIAIFDGNTHTLRVTEDDFAILEAMRSWFRTDGRVIAVVTD